MLGRACTRVALAVGILGCAPHEELAVEAVPTFIEAPRAARTAPVPTTAYSVSGCILRHGRGFASGSPHAAALLDDCRFHPDERAACVLDRLLGLDAALCIARVEGLLAPRHTVLFLREGRPEGGIEPTSPRRAVWRISGMFDDGRAREIEISAHDGQVARVPDPPPPPRPVP